MPAYSIIFSVIEAYSHIMRHYFVKFGLIQACSAPCVTLTFSQPFHMVSPGIFGTRGLFKPCETFTRNIRNPAMGIIQPYSEPYAMLAYAKIWHTQNLEYSELFHNYISTQIQKPAILRKFKHIQN